MSDQFSEWDKFYQQYERSLTPEQAFQRYKRKRKPRGRPRSTKTPLQKLQEAYEKRVAARRTRQLQFEADMLATESALRASKSTTKG